MDTDLEIALQLADTADALSLPRFGASDLRVDAKPDMTPVSDADTAVERALRSILASARPTDAVCGEEYGAGDLSAARCWVIDPIDGTKNYVRGVPLWATLIALFDASQGPAPVLGVVSAPAMCRRWWAGVGEGAWMAFGGPGAGSLGAVARRCHVSAVSTVSDASLAYSELGEWRAAGGLAGFMSLYERCWRTRGYGDFYSYMLLAEGAVDLAAEPELSLWDLAALAPIVTEAGGAFTDLAGAPVSRTTRCAAASNGLLHPVLLGAIGV